LESVVDVDGLSVAGAEVCPDDGDACCLGVGECDAVLGGDFGAGVAGLWCVPGVVVWSSDVEVGVVHVVIVSGGAGALLRATP